MGQTVDGTGVNAYSTGHAGLQVNLRFFPGRALDPFANNSKRIRDCRCRADPATGPAIDAKERIDQVEVFLFSRNGANRAELETGAATIACFADSI